MPYDFHVTALDLGDFKDPGDAAAADPGFLAHALELMRPAFERLIRHAFGMPGAETIAGKKRLVREFLRKVKRLKSSVEVKEWLGELAGASGISAVALESELAEVPAAETEAAAAAAPETPADRADRIASRLLTLAFTNDQFLATVKDNRALLPAAYQQALDLSSSEGSALKEMEASVHTATDPEALKSEFNALLRELKIEHLRIEQSALQTALRAAGAAGNDGATLELSRKFNDLSRELNALRGT